MERRKFVQSSLLAATAFASAPSAFADIKPVVKKELYEWREYEIHFGADQKLLHTYLETSLIPALNKAGVKHVGVFKELSKEEPTHLYVLIVYPSFEEYSIINTRLKSDAAYQGSSVPYNQLPKDKMIYNRISTSLLTAFDGMPAAKVPARATRIFELRTYEGFSEDAVRRKVKMFNESEFGIFERTGLNAVFFGEMIAGKNVPCLTYMLTFSSMDEREKNWAAFGADPEWKKISADPQYADSVSNIIRIFLEPLPFSQI